MKKYSLKVSARDTKKSKPKKLRRQGLIPATVYGKNIKSLSIEMVKDEFVKIYEDAGETGVIELQTDKDTRPTLIGNVQLHPVLEDVLHVEFRQVDLKQKISANVPIEIVGEPEAVSQKLGLLITLLDEIEVEALPTNLPESIRVEVAKLSQVGDEIKVSDLPAIADVEYKAQSDEVIVKIEPLPEEEVQASAATPEAEIPAEGQPDTEEAADKPEKAAKEKAPEKAAADKS